MIDNLKRLNDLDIVLAKMDEDALNQLYYRVFEKADGELIMQDLANRCHVYTNTTSEFEEGMRAMWLSIQSRIRAAVAPQEVVNAE